MLNPNEVLGELYPQLKRPRWRPDPLFWLCFILVIIILFSIIINVARAEMIDLSIIAEIESNNNPLAYNRKSNARGLFQVTEICLKDYNQIHSTYWQPKDLFNPTLNTTIARWYLTVRIPRFLNNYHKSVTIENILICYNAGISWVIYDGNLPRETRQYIEKHKRLSTQR